jgi:hypothetical protein
LRLSLGSDPQESKSLGGRDMKHFSTEEWIDFAKGLAPSDRQVVMQEHLATGCKRCKETVSVWQKVSKTASAEAKYQPPREVVRLAQSLFAGSGLARKKNKSQSSIEVLFDSFLQPALAGVRSTVLGMRQMLYKADPFQIDVQIEAKPGTNRLVVTGQLLDLSYPGVIGRDILVTLSNHRGSRVVVATSQFGEFSGEIENSGDLELSIPNQGSDPIVIQLRNALGNLRGGKH